MRSTDDLRRLLQRIDSRSYPAYRDLRGVWALDHAELCVDHVQGDPFAAPSHLRLRVDVGLGTQGREQPTVRLATEDWLLRAFSDGLRSTRRGSGRSGVLDVYRPGPEVMERSAVRWLSDGRVEVRLRAGLPARGRRVLGDEAWQLLSVDLKQAADNLSPTSALPRHIRSVVRQQALRSALPEAGLVAFVANGSILPRRSGVDGRPLERAVPFTSPESLEVTLPTPEGPVTGMGLPEGVTVITGGGFHGKSTLLQALQRGHLDHIPGDGRAGVVTRATTVKLRAEDGRRVCKVNISGFLTDLPGGRSTAPFSTEDASGSTSQAASIVEALESGATTLLLDEDTSATNLLVRDKRMQQLIAREPITPFVERVRELSTLGVSTVMVVGGAAETLGEADVVLLMEDFEAKDVTARAHALVPRGRSSHPPLPPVVSRVPLRAGLEARKVRTRDERRVQYGDTELELSAVEQVLDPAHAASIAAALQFLHQHLVDDSRGLHTVLDALESILDDEGVEALSARDFPTGALLRPRRHEVAAALSRLRTLTVAD